MPKPDAATQLAIYEMMARCRGVDEHVRGLIMSGAQMFVFYPCTGQEAIAAGIGMHLSSDDYLCTTYRGVHDQVAKGIPLPLLYAEYLGKTEGACRGRGGPMHITHPPTGVMVTTGIVGGGIPIANGLGLASQVKGDRRVTVCNFGDGAANIGAFHESLNLAALWKLPVVFVCQNNQWAEHTEFRDSVIVERLGERAAGYGIPGFTVDGLDPEEVYDVAGTAIERARAGEGPTLIEATCYRLNGHFFGDDGKYMPEGALERAWTRDPVALYRAKLLESGRGSSEQLAEIEAAIEAEIESAYASALEGQHPDPKELCSDVYSSEVLV